MSEITSETSLIELAAIVSGTLNKAGITAVLSGGGAVSTYTDNKYETVDLDFVTAAGLVELGQALLPLGFSKVRQDEPGISSIRNAAGTSNFHRRHFPLVANRFGRVIGRSWKPPSA